MLMQGSQVENVVPKIGTVPILFLITAFIFTNHALYQQS